MKRKVTDLLLESVPLLKSQAVRLGNYGNDIDDLTELLHDDNVNGTERMAGWVDEEETAMDTGVLDMAVSHRCELLAKIRAVLVLDVLDNGIPTRTRW